MRAVIIILAVAIALSGCGGMGKAAYQTGKTFDKYGCLAGELKGETPCPPEEVAAPQ